MTTYLKRLLTLEHAIDYCLAHREWAAVRRLNRLFDKCFIETPSSDIEKYFNGYSDDPTWDKKLSFAYEIINSKGVSHETKR